MFEILQYNFFQNALIGGVIIALISWFFWVFVIMRKEANITHSISNFLFLGIALSLLLEWNYYWYSAIFAIVASIVIYSLERTKLVTTESSKELIAQGWIAWGIFVVSLMSHLQLHIHSLLFGSILSITSVDIWMVSIFWLLCVIIYYFFGRNFLGVILNESISKAKGIRTEIYNMCFLLLLSFFIALSIKIFGILLIWAFLVIPANSAKVISGSVKQMFVYSILFAVIWLLIWMFGAYYLETSTGATIVLSLLVIFICSVLYKRFSSARFFLLITLWIMLLMAFIFLWTHDNKWPKLDNNPEVLLPWDMHWAWTWLDDDSNSWNGWSADENWEHWNYDYIIDYQENHKHEGHDHWEWEHVYGDVDDNNKALEEIELENIEEVIKEQSDLHDEQNKEGNISIHWMEHNDTYNIHNIEEHNHNH